MMDPTIVMFLIAQSVVIVGAVVASHISTKVAIAKLQVNSINIEVRLKDLKEDHRKLSGKVDGISRHVARMEAVHLRCPYVRGDKASAG